MRLLYLDLNNSGISGDMFLASLLGLTQNHTEILIELENLKNFLSGVSKLEIKLLHTERDGIKLNQMLINIKESKEHRTSKALQKSLNEFMDTINISDHAKNYANDVLNTLIEAEAEVHGKEANNIHLHELSSIDTLIDIIGVTICLDKIDAFKDDLEFYCSKIPLGGGKINTKHGILAVPAPATLKILERSDLITYGGPIDSELVTPTGVALLANLNPKFLPYPNEMKIIKSIYSTGQKKFNNFINVMRIFLGEGENKTFSDFRHPLTKYIEKVAILETDVDDVSGEIIGNFISSFDIKEILDIQIFPSITKKNRPANIIKILCYPNQIFKIIEKIINELGTLGVRYNIFNRVCIGRKIEKKDIEIQGNKYEISYKVSFIESTEGKTIINIKPEFEDLKRINKLTGLNIRKIRLLALKKIQEIYKID